MQYTLLLFHIPEQAQDHAFVNNPHIVVVIIFQREVKHSVAVQPPHGHASPGFAK
jgi:hypothetical protein